MKKSIVSKDRRNDLLIMMRKYENVKVLKNLKSTIESRIHRKL